MHFTQENITSHTLKGFLRQHARNCADAIPRAQVRRLNLNPSGHSGSRFLSTFTERGFLSMALCSRGAPRASINHPPRSNG